MKTASELENIIMIKELKIQQQNLEIERLKADLQEANDSVTWWQNRFNSEHKEIERLNNIINEFEDFITNVDSHINLGDESEEFILVRDKWLELQELKGSEKE